MFSIIQEYRSIDVSGNNSTMNSDQTWLQEMTFQKFSNCFYFYCPEIRPDDLIAKIDSRSDSRRPWTLVNSYIDLETRLPIHFNQIHIFVLIDEDFPVLWKNS